MPDPVEFAKQQIENLEKIREESFAAWQGSKNDGVGEPAFLHAALNAIEQQTQLMAIFSQGE